MFCPKCGAENADNAKFCAKCGSLLTQSSAANTNNASIKQPTPEKPKAEKTEAGNVKADKPIKKVPIGAIIGIGVAVVAVIAAAVFFKNKAETIDLDKYVSLSASGTDGYGEATAQIDWATIEETYSDKVSYTSAAKKAMGFLSEFATPMDALEESISVDVDPNSGLSNGDEVSYKWDIQEDIDKYLNVKLKYSDGTFKVSDLEKVGTFDAFADLDVIFDGVAPNGTARFTYNGAELDASDFQVDKTTGLSNGDVVTVTIDESKIGNLAQDIGKIPAETKKEYTVEGLEGYVTKLADIDEATMESIKKQAEDAFNAYVAKVWEDYITVDSFTYCGDYLLTAKDIEDVDDYNKLILVYHYVSNINNTDRFNPYSGKVDGYWCVTFKGLRVESDGKLYVDLTEYETPRGSFVFEDRWRYEGYKTFDELHRDVINADADLYKVEDNAKDTSAGETASTTSN